MGRLIHTDTIIMVWTTECIISTIYIVININKYKIKLSLTNDVVGVGVGVGVGVSVAVAVGGVIVSSVIVSSGGALATAVDVSTGAAVAANIEDAVGAVVPPSSTKDEDAYVGALVAFKGVCVGAFADGASESAAASAQLPPRCCHHAVCHRRAWCCRHPH